MEERKGYHFAGWYIDKRKGRCPQQRPLDLHNYKLPNGPSTLQ